MEFILINVPGDCMLCLFDVARAKREIRLISMGLGLQVVVQPVAQPREFLRSPDVTRYCSRLHSVKARRRSNLIYYLMFYV